MIEIPLVNKKKFQKMWRNFIEDINLCDTCMRRSVCSLKTIICFDKTFACVEYESKSEE